MTEEMKFFLFLIERYAQFKGRPTGEVLREWDRKGITQEIYDSPGPDASPVFFFLAFLNGVILHLIQLDNEDVERSREPI